ncbi:MAG: alpha/beta fold hydrolase [Gammaproteobacteria bacterium]
MKMSSRFYLGLNAHGFHRLHYLEWAAPGEKPTAVCVHGLTRNARDFDALAATMQTEFRVICPDVAGRGKSDWLAGAGDYGLAQYAADMTALIARLDVERVDWVGASMGGLIGMSLASRPGTPIRRLILNDVGPYIAQSAMQRIAEYVGEDPRFAELAEAEAYLRRVHAPMGRLSDDQWRHMAEHSTRRLEDGGYRLHYDPAIGNMFRKEAIEAIDLWHVWDAIRCPVLVLRGAQSDVLTAETAREMTQRGPGARVETLADIGHAPALHAADQIGLIRAWLGQT